MYVVCVHLFSAKPLTICLLNQTSEPTEFRSKIGQLVLDRAPVTTCNNFGFKPATKQHFSCSVLTKRQHFPNRKPCWSTYRETPHILIWKSKKSDWWPSPWFVTKEQYLVCYWAPTHKYFTHALASSLCLLPPAPPSPVTYLGSQLSNRGDFFLSGPPHTQKCSPTQNLSTPSVGSQNGPLKPPATCLELKVHNLQILKIVDLQGMSTNSIMPSHNVDPKLVHWLSRVQQNWPCGVIFVGD